MSNHDSAVFPGGRQAFPLKRVGVPSALRSLAPYDLDVGERTREIVHSPYLVQRYLSQSDENLFNYVKFRLIADVLRQLPGPAPSLLDLGCADQVGRRYLAGLDCSFRYCGVDYEASFAPDVVADLRAPEQILPQLPWQPDVILLLDVLEHLDGQEADIVRVLETCRAILPPGGLAPK